MKKAVYHGIRDIRVEEVADPAPGQGEVEQGHQGREGEDERL